VNPSTGQPCSLALPYAKSVDHVMAEFEVIVRPFEHKDYTECCTLFRSGIKEAIPEMTRIVAPRYLCYTGVLLLAVAAVRWSLQELFVYLIVCGILTVLLVYIRVYLEMKGFTDDVLNTDLHDIDEFYEDDSRMFVAELDGQIFGMACIARKAGFHKPGVAELKRMHVSSAIRNRGIAKKLLKQVERFCKGKKYNKVVLDTCSNRYAALGLYKKFGFEIEHIDPYPAMFMEDLKVVFLEKRLESED